MKKGLIILLLIIPSISNAQLGWKDRDWQQVVGFGCGAAGGATELVRDMFDLFENQDFDVIKKKLESEQSGLDSFQSISNSKNKIRNRKPFKAPIFPEYFIQQEIAFATMVSFIEIIGSHNRGSTRSN